MWPIRRVGRTDAGVVPYVVRVQSHLAAGSDAQNAEILITSIKRTLDPIAHADVNDRLGYPRR